MSIKTLTLKCNPEFVHVTTVGKFDVFKSKKSTCCMGNIIKTISNEYGFTKNDITIEMYQKLYENNVSWYQDFLHMFEQVFCDLPKDYFITRIGINYDFYRDEEMYIFDVVSRKRPLRNVYTYIALYDTKFTSVF